MNGHTNPSPWKRDDRKVLEPINLWWSELYQGGDPGATKWDVLDDLQNLVVEALGRSPPDVARALCLTAKAALLIEGSRIK